MKKIKLFFIFAFVALFSLFFSTKLVATPPQINNTTKNDIAFENSLVNLKDDLTKENLISMPTTSTVKKTTTENSLNLKEIFSSSPLIYTILSVMSVASCIILFYTLLTFRPKDLMSKQTIKHLKNLLLNEQYEEALLYCKDNKTLLASMISSGINSRKHGAQYMIETIKAEGSRSVSGFWQRITLLNDITLIAPMLGLLGTVIGMFYAFYDINRSIDTLSSLFDGLGIAVGTTVAGLIVAILATCFYTILKFKMMKALSKVEKQAIYLGNLIKTRD